jgi:hypothetical protein
MCNKGKCEVSKKIIGALIDQPLLGSVFIADFFLVFFIKSMHWTFTALMLGGLVAMSMYYGQKLALFKTCQAAQPEAAESTEKAD